MAKQALPSLTERELIQPVEQPSVLRRAGNTALGGISAIGNLLDLPGSFVRDVLTFNNPLDQLLSPFSPDNRATGGDILRGLGMIGKEDTLTNLGPRVGLELALDPLTYLSFGVLSGGGKAAKAIGVLDKASDVATASRLAKGAAATAPKATGAAIKTSAAMTPGTASEGAAALTKAGLGGRSTLTSTVVGPREAKRTTNLKEILSTLTVGDQTRALSNLDDYAKKLKMRDADELLAKHGHEPLASSGRFGVPLTDVGAAFNSSGLDRVGRWLDLSQNYVKWSAPWRAVRLLFDNDAGGQFTRQGQEVASAIAPLKREAAARAASAAHEVMTDIERLKKPFMDVFGGEDFNLPGISIPEFKIEGAEQARNALERVIRLSAELHGKVAPNAVGGVSPTSLERSVNALLPKTAKVMPADLVTQLNELTGKMKDSMRLLRDSLDESGVKIGDVDFDWIGHYPRYGVPKHYSEYAGMKQRLAPSSGAANESRIKAISTLPADVVQAILHDPMIRKGKFTKAEKLAMQAAGQPVPVIGPARVMEIIQDFTGPIQRVSKSGQVKTLSVKAQANAAYKYAREHSLDFLGERRLFNAPVEDFAKYMGSAHRLAAVRDGAYNTLLRSADDMRRVGQHDGPVKTIGETLKRAGYDADKGTLFMAKMASHADPVKYAAELKGMMIPVEVSDAVSSVVEKSISPEWGNMLTFYMDKITRVFKENLTLPFPGFWVRNGFSGQMMNMMSNHISTPGDIGDYYEAVKFAHEVRLHPEKYPEFMREIHTHDVFRYGFHSADIPEHVKLTQGINMPPIRETVDQAMKGKGPGMLERAAANYSPELAAGVAQATDPLRRAHETVLEFGRQQSAKGEWYNRVAMHSYLRKKGYAPEVAAQITRDIHVDYGDLTKFEKDVARRSALFYTFTRKQLEQTAKRIYDNPGGLPGISIAGTIKAINRARDPGEMLPDYIAETASIPLGADEEGNRNFVTGFGLAFEDPLSFFGKGLRGTGMEMLSRLHPLAKAPLEHATGELFFQSGPGGGRDLKDADPLLGRAIANVMGMEQPVRLPEALEVAIANSPAARLISTTRQLADPRKNVGNTLLNLASGIRSTTVSPAATDALLREAVSEQLRTVGGKQFTRTYIPDHVKSEMSPQEMADAMQLSDTMNELARRTKARKKLKADSAKS